MLDSVVKFFTKQTRKPNARIRLLLSKAASLQSRSVYPDLVLSAESRCGAVAIGCGCLLSPPLVRRCPNTFSLSPFPHPAHRTGHADFPHPALGQDLRLRPYLAINISIVVSKVSFQRLCASLF